MSHCRVRWRLSVTVNLGLLGIARKAKALEYGEETVSSSISAGKARLVLLAADAGEHTKRRIVPLADRNGVTCLEIPSTKDELGLAVGKGGTGVVSIIDMGIAASIAEKLAPDGEEYAKAYEKLREKAEKMKRRKKETEAHRKNIQTGRRRAK